jgi:hypothetical protein
MALRVFFHRDRFNALPVANEGIRQTRPFAVASAAITQCLVADLAKDVGGAISHPEIGTLEPLELEVLVVPD